MLFACQAQADTWMVARTSQSRLQPRHTIGLALTSAPRRRPWGLENDLSSDNLASTPGQPPAERARSYARSSHSMGRRSCA